VLPIVARFNNSSGGGICRTGNKRCLSIKVFKRIKNFDGEIPINTPIRSCGAEPLEADARCEVFRGRPRDLTRGIRGTMVPQRPKGR